MGANSQNVEGVGIAVDLFDGDSTLTTLRAIRSEMVAIASLGSGQQGNSIYGPSQTGLAQLEANYRSQERIEQDHITRMGRLRAESSRSIGTNEVDVLAQNKLRKAELSKQVSERARAIEADQARKDLEQQERLAQEVLQRRARINALQQSDVVTGAAGRTQNDQQRSLFQRYRNDPARDDLTNQYRRQIAEQTVAQREYVRQKRKLDDEFEAEQQREFQRIRSNIQNHLAAPSPLEQSLAEGRGGSYVDPLTTRRIQRRGINARASAGDDADVRTIGGVQGKFSTNSKGQLEFVPLGGGGAGGPEEPEGGSGGSGGSGGGVAGIIGRAAAYFALYQVLRTVVTGTKELVTASLEAAKATTEQGNALRYATEAAGGNLQANRALAEGIQKFGYSRIEAQQVVATASRISYRHPEDVGGLTQLATDIAASRGGGLEKAPGVLQDIVEGRDRTYREYFNTTPEDIYKQAGKKAIEAQSAQDYRGIGNKNYDTEAQKVTKYVSALTEEEKEQLRLNYALSQSGRFSGDAAERATTLAGKMDLVSASFSNAVANIGLFITSIGPVKNLLDSLSGPTALDFLKSPVLDQSGPQSTITSDDISKFGQESVSGPQARSRGTLSKVLAAIFPLIPGIGILKTPGQVATQLRSGEGPGPFNLPGIDNQGNEITRALAETQATRAQIKRDAEIAAKGEFEKRYRYIGPDQTRPLTETITGQQLAQRGDAVGNGRGGFSNYEETLVPITKPSVPSNTADLDKYREEAQKREDARQEKERQAREKQIQEQERALSKLREFRQGSFRIIDETASRITGGDNPFVKVLSDQITAAQRMHEQWGFLGKDIEAYELKLEQAAQNKALNKLEFGAYAAGTNLQGQAAREAAQRSAPGVLGLSRKDEDSLGIQEAILNKAINLASLQKSYRESLGYKTNPIFDAQNRVNQIALGLGTNLGRPFEPGTLNGVSFAGGQRAGFSAGERTSTFIGPNGQQITTTLDAGRRDDYAAYDVSRLGQLRDSPEVQKRTRQLAADATIDALKDLTPAQLRRSGLGDVYRGALNVKAGGLNEQIDDAYKKAQYNAQEDERLKKQLADDEDFRRKQVALGRNPADVQTEADRLLLSRTQGINPKDLDFETFKNRQEALQRQAKDEFGKESEAKEATQVGLDLQASMLEQIDAIRKAIISGDMGLTLTVNNDTDARLDTDALRNANPENTSNKDTQLSNTDNLGANALKRYQRFGKRD